MPTPTDATTLDPWAIYMEDASWPAVSGHRFIVEAVAELAAIKFGIDPYTIAHDHEHPALRNEIATVMAELLMKGSLVASARPVGGGRLVPIAEAEWTAESATDAVARGFVRQRHRSDRTHPHHVFIGTAETAMMGRVYTITDMLYSRADQGTDEELGAIVLGNLSAIAGNKVALAPADSARRVLQLRLPSLSPALDYDDERKLVTAAAGWLVRRFEADARDGTGLLRADFLDEAVEQFSPFMSKRLFEKVWAEATGLEVDGKQPHKSRTLHGRRSVAGRRTAGPRSAA